MAIGTNIKRRFGKALASAAFAGLICFGTAAMAQTPVTTAPDDVMLNQVRADLARIGKLTDLGVRSFGDVHIEPIDIHWGRIVAGAPLVHYGEIPALDGTPSGSSVVFDILNKKGELVEQVWVGIFLDAELQWDCSTSFCILPSSSLDRAAATETAITGAILTNADPFPAYVMVGVIDPDKQAKWFLLGGNPLCPVPTILGLTILGDGCEEIGPDGLPVFIPFLAIAMSGLSEVSGLSHTVLLDATAIEYALITLLLGEVIRGTAEIVDIMSTLGELDGALTPR